MQRPAESIRRIDNYYDKMHDSYKVGANYMSFYNIAEETKVNARRGYYPLIYYQIIENIQKETLKSGKLISSLHFSKVRFSTKTSIF